MDNAIEDNILVAMMWFMKSMCLMNIDVRKGANQAMEAIDDMLFDCVHYR